MEEHTYETLIESH